MTSRSSPFSTIVFAYLALLSAVQFVAAATIGGRLTSSFYSYDGADVDTNSVAHLRVYQAARLNVGEVAHPSLSFNTYLRGTTDVAEEADSDPRLQIYSAYLRWQPSRADLRLGRQRVYTGVGFGSMDGLYSKLERAGFELTGYAGTLVPLDKSTAINSWSDGRIWGARVSTRRYGETAIALSFAHRERSRRPYEAPGVFSGLTLKPGAVVRRVAGLDLQRGFAGGHNLYLRLDYDLKDESVRRSELRGRYLLSRNLVAQVELLRREPAVFHNSLFSVFAAQAYQEVGGRVDYQVNPSLQLGGHVATVLYDGDDTQRLGVTASFGSRYGVSYYRSTGFANASDGLSGHLQVPLTPQLTLQGAMDLTSYERYRDADEREELVVGSVGLRYRPTRATSIEAHLQGLRNPLFSRDGRLLVRAGWRFFKGRAR